MTFEYSYSVILTSLLRSSRNAFGLPCSNSVVPKIVCGIEVRGAPSDSAANPVLLVLIAACLLGLPALIAINFIIFPMLRLATSRLSVRSSVPLAQIHNVLQGGPNLGRSLLYPVSMASFAT